MTCEAWTPEGRRSCRSYVQRAFAVMLCCVLCLGLIQPPKSQAVAAEVGLVVAGSVAAAPVAATIGVICLAVVGVGFLQGAFDNTDSIYYGTAVYDWGYKFAQACEAAGGAVHDWYVAQVAACADGLAAGQQIEVPAEVAEYARQWAVENIDFSSGDFKVTQNGVFDDSGQVFLFYHVLGISSSHSTEYVSGGSFIALPSTVDSYVEYSFTNNDITENFRLYNRNGYPGIFTGSSWMSGRRNAGGGFAYDSVSGIVYFGFVSLDRQEFSEVMRSDILSELVMPCAATMTKTRSFDDPIDRERPLVATIPDDIPFVDVGAIPIPVFSDLTREKLGVGEQVEPTVPPTTVPGEQTQVGDIALEDIQAQQASLGAVFISKFPFSIPWDFAAAVELLAAPPKTPHWEVDFMAPLEHRVGSWAGDTTIVIDFSDFEILGQLCRWVTTIMFCAALISGTKRLIWTA